MVYAGWLSEARRDLRNETKESLCGACSQLADIAAGWTECAPTLVLKTHSLAAQLILP